MAASTPTSSKGAPLGDNDHAKFLFACLSTIDPPPKIDYQVVADKLGIVSKEAAQKRHYRLQKAMAAEGGSTPTPTRKKPSSTETNGDEDTPTKPRAKPKAEAKATKATPTKKRAAEDTQEEEQTSSKKVKGEDEEAV